MANRKKTIHTGINRRIDQRSCALDIRCEQIRAHPTAFDTCQVIDSIHTYHRCTQAAHIIEAGDCHLHWHAPRQPWRLL